MIWHNEYAETWQRRFAWWPQQLSDGLSMWLGWYEQRFIPHAPPGVSEDLHIVGYWERRPVQRPLTCQCPSMGHPEQCDEGQECRWVRKLTRHEPPNVEANRAPGTP